MTTTIRTRTAMRSRNPSSSLVRRRNLTRGAASFVETFNHPQDPLVIGPEDELHFHAVYRQVLAIPDVTRVPSLIPWVITTPLTAPSWPFPKSAPASLPTSVIVWHPALVAGGSSELRHWCSFDRFDELRSVVGRRSRKPCEPSNNTLLSSAFHDIFRRPYAPPRTTAIRLWRPPPPRVSTVVPVERFVKVKANNDVDKDVHYRASNNLKATLCGMQIAGLSTEGEVTCYRCHQFAVGDI